MSFSTVAVRNAMEICDLSEGIEKFKVAGPVSCSISKEHPFKYVKTNIPGPGCDSKIFSQQYLGCRCKGICVIDSCACLQHFGIAYSSDGKLKERYFQQKSSRPVLECGKDCSCKKDHCVNRVVQRGINKVFQVFMTETRGYGLKLMGDRNISQFSFVCEYAGEVIGEEEARHRVRINENDGKDNYIIALREQTPAGDNCIYIDPCYFGNLGRFINHSCDPNLIMVPVRINHPIPRLALFACKDITAGEELTFDYSGTTFLSSSPFFNKKINTIKHSEHKNVNTSDNPCKTCDPLSSENKTFQDCTPQHFEEDQTCKKMKMEKPEQEDKEAIYLTTNSAICHDSAVNTENNMHTADMKVISSSHSNNTILEQSVPIIQRLYKNQSQGASDLNKKEPASQEVDISDKEFSVSPEVRDLEPPVTQDMTEVTVGAANATKRKPCDCHSNNCTGFLPFDDTLLCD